MKSASGSVTLTRVRRRLNYGIDQWSISGKLAPLDADSNVYRRLPAYYAEDTRVLEQLIG